jgi:methanethiol S-methyltransferase
VLSSTFLINRFELFGLHQVTSHLNGQPMPAPKFVTPMFYKVVRHPTYLGFVIAFWAAPVMTIGQRLFAAVTSIWLEERDLIVAFGDYRQYRNRVGMILPLPGRKRATPVGRFACRTSSASLRQKRNWQRI